MIFFPALSIFICQWLFFFHIQFRFPTFILFFSVDDFSARSSRSVRFLSRSLFFFLIPFSSLDFAPCYDYSMWSWYRRLTLLPSFSIPLSQLFSAHYAFSILFFFFFDLLLSIFQHGFSGRVICHCMLIDLFQFLSAQLWFSIPVIVISCLLLCLSLPLIHFQFLPLSNFYPRFPLPIFLLLFLLFSHPTSPFLNFNSHLVWSLFFPSLLCHFMLLILSIFLFPQLCHSGCVTIFLSHFPSRVYCVLFFTVFYFSLFSVLMDSGEVLKLKLW